MDRILVTDGQQRKSLAATRSLGRKGHTVFVADETRFSTSRFSRHCQQGLVCPEPRRTEAFWQWLLDTQRRHRVDMLLPTDDDTTALAVQRQHQLPYCTLLPTPAQFAAGRDKRATMSLAEQAHVRCPVSAEATSLTDVQTTLAKLGGKGVLKARTSSGGRGIFFVNSPAEAAQHWTRIRPDWGGLLVQERIPLGRKFDVCLLFGPNGDLRASFVQEELRWFPLEYGTSTLQQSVHRPDLIDLALRLIRPIGWRGPVEVEFMEGPDGTPVLMEINPRLWASVALAIRCGVDFPALIADLAAGRDVRGPETYPAGIRCRWLLPGDLLHWLATRGRQHRGLRTTGDTHAFDDIISREDPGPTLGFVLAALRYGLDPQMWRTLLRW